jgi:phosphomannomutase
MTSVDQSIFKAYDIRGVYPTQINEEHIADITRAIYSFFREKIGKEQFTIAIGQDMRTSSPSLFAVVKQTLLEAGATLVDVGLVSTPTFYFAVSHYNYDAGIQVTASHNPKEYNGMKFVLNSPNGLIKIGKSTGMEEIKKRVATGVTLEKKATGSITQKSNVTDDEVTNALTILENPPLKKFKIVADPANAMGITYLEALFHKVPADVVKMNFELDGTFPVHQPDPLDFNNLVDLQKKVIEEKADFGLAPDGDGDRLFFIDEKGQVVPASLITGIISREFLKHNPGATILFDIRYIFTPRKIVEENGGKYDITKVGHAFITEKMTQTGAVFGGESSAHYFYKATGNGESQLITILTVMKVLTEENKTLSELADEVRRSYESGEINFVVENASAILAKLKEKYADTEISELDGVSVSQGDWRCNVRTSNTEPLLRLNVEAFDKEILEKQKIELVELLLSLGAKPKTPGH